MPRYHVNPETGNPGICRADPSKPNARGCDFNLAEDQHYESPEDARLGYEAKMAAETFAGAVSTKSSDIRANRLDPIDFDELDPSTHAAIKDYQGWNFDRWNDSLRRGNLSTESRSFRDSVAKVDELIASQSTDKPMVLFRSLKSAGGRASFVPEVGSTYSDRAYMSFSQNPEHQDFLEGNWYEEGYETDDDTPCEYDLVLEVEAPEGSKALAMPTTTRIEASEQEVLLPRDSKIQILERIEEEDSEGNPRIRLKGRLVSEELP